METPIVAYHQATKHHFRVFARGPGHLDWANQPDPFRRYIGATCIPLDHSPGGERPDYDLFLQPPEESSRMPWESL